MANIKASKKDIRRSAKRRVQNSRQRARLRSYDKKIRALVSEKKFDEAAEAFKTFSSYLDRAGRRHLIHPSQADRRKGRMASLINKAKAA